MIDGQMLVAALCIAWLAQCLSGWLQMGRYRTTLRALALSRPDGWLATGAARGRFGQRAVAILVVGPDGVVDRSVVTRGWSSLAGYHPRTEEQGRPIESLATAPATDLPGQAVVDAARRACRLREESHPEAAALVPACA